MCLWPTDEQILQTFHHSRQLASELAKFLGMIQPENLPISIDPFIILIDANNEDVSMYTNDTNNEIEISEESEIDLSIAIDKASTEVRRNNEKLDDESVIEGIFNDGCSQIQLLDKKTDTISVLNYGDSGKFIILNNNDILFVFKIFINIVSLINSE